MKHNLIGIDRATAIRNRARMNATDDTTTAREPKTPLLFLLLSLYSSSFVVLSAHHQSCQLLLSLPYGFYAVLELLISRNRALEFDLYSGTLRTQCLADLTTESGFTSHEKVPSQLRFFLSDNLYNI